ncbi:MAG: chitin-binding protein [bacterium]|nr:chitin-binding protein [bacterium]
MKHQIVCLSLLLLVTTSISCENGEATSGTGGDSDNGTDSDTDNDTDTDTDGDEVMTTGQIEYHLHLGLSEAQDIMILDGDGYTDLIMSNFIAGVLLGHLIKNYYPGMQYDRDYLYGSIFAQLLQENIATHWYTSDQDLIAPDPRQQSVMGAGQGGPYQINNYAADMVGGGYEPAGYSLINMVAVQKNIGYTMDTAAEQHTQVTPQSFNNKYIGPILTSYFHYIDFVALVVVGTGEDGWVTPWQPAYDNCLAHFKDLANNFLEVILNVAYNQGFYGGLVNSYSTLGATATESTIATVRSYSSVWGQEWYAQYPYQVMYYLDQMYNNPIPRETAANTDPNDLVTPANRIAFKMTQLADVFSSVYQSLAYIDGSGQYVSISASQAEEAFNAGLLQAGVSNTAVLDLGKTLERARIFDVLEDATSALEANIGMKFNVTTMEQL